MGTGKLVSRPVYRHERLAKKGDFKMNKIIFTLSILIAAFTVTYGFAQMGPGYMGPGMMGWGYGMGWGWSIIMIAFWIAVIAGIIFLIRWMVMSTDKGSTAGKEDSAMDILRKRYARGEINKEEFEEKKKDLGT